MYNILDIARMQGNELTDEQILVINSMDDSLLINANPGTGKTTTMIYGVINLVLNKNVNPERILCMSYSRESARSLHFKYSSALKKAVGNAADLLKSPEFSTFHSFCLKQHNSPQVITSEEDEKELLKSYLVRSNRKISKDVNYNKLYRVFKYITTFGVSDERDLNKCADFKKLCDLEELDFITVMDWYKAFFKYKCGTKYFTQADMPLITLNKILTEESYAKSLLDKYDYIIIDEMQDMNLIYLLTISYFAKKLIAIGDIKQQIYRYNGSDDSIIGLFNYAYPTAKILELTQSFRCDKRIADYSSEIIKCNNYNGFTKFTGKDNNGGVHLIKRRQFYEALKMMSHKFVERNEWDEYMFLYRFNRTGILAAHELYNYEYAPLYTMEYINSLYNIYLSNKANIDRYYLASINISNDKLTNAFNRMRKEEISFLDAISKEELSKDESDVVNLIRDYNSDTNSNKILSEYINEFKNDFDKIFRKSETMFSIDEYINLLTEYSDKTFSEFIASEEEKKNTKKLKNKFPIHYPKYKQIYTMIFIKELQYIWDVYRNPYNPQVFETVFNKTKFKLRNKESAVKAYMKTYSCSYKEAIEKCTVSDAERAFYNTLIRIIDTMCNHNICEYIDGFTAVISKYYDRSAEYLEWYERDITNNIEMLVTMYGDKKWEYMLCKEDEKYQHIQTTISLDYGIKFKTMHASKGLESRRVVILDYEADALADKEDLDKTIRNGDANKAVEELRDERCLLFVALTRAINDVYCIYDQTPTLLDVNYYNGNQLQYIDAMHVTRVKRNIMIGNEKINVVVHGNVKPEEDIFKQESDNAIQDMIEFVDTIEEF